VTEPEEVSVIPGFLTTDPVGWQCVWGNLLCNHRLFKQSLEVEFANLNNGPWETAVC
jgi:hypothetical protein